jgi:hypothetical protein
MSAAAVAAVRPGARTAFSLASAPADPPRRRPGHPTTRAMGFTSRGEIIATPMNKRTQPPATAVSTAATPSPFPNRA